LIIEAASEVTIGKTEKMRYPSFLRSRKTGFVGVVLRVWNHFYPCIEHMVLPRVEWIDYEIFA
jgi:hypothetical protein